MDYIILDGKVFCIENIRLSDFSLKFAPELIQGRMLSVHSGFYLYRTYFSFFLYQKVDFHVVFSAGCVRSGVKVQLVAA